MPANGRADAHFGLDQSVLAPLSCSMEKENYGPFLTFVPFEGNIDLVAVRFTVQRDPAVEESRFALNGLGNSFAWGVTMPYAF